MVLRGICVNGGRGEFPEPIYDGARKNALKQGCSTYPQVEDFDVYLKMINYTKLVVEVSFYLHSSQDIYGPLSQMSHFCQAVGTKHCPYTLYKQQRTSAEKIDTQEKNKIWKRGAPLFCKYFGPKNHFFVHKQGNYSLRRPPKLVIPQAVLGQRWATVYSNLYKQTVIHSKSTS